MVVPLVPLRAHLALKRGNKPLLRQQETNAVLAVQKPVLLLQQKVPKSQRRRVVNVQVGHELNRHNAPPQPHPVARVAPVRKLRDKPLSRRNKNAPLLEPKPPHKVPPPPQHLCRVPNKLRKPQPKPVKPHGKKP